MSIRKKIFIGIMCFLLIFLLISISLLLLYNTSESNQVLNGNKNMIETNTDIIQETSNLENEIVNTNDNQEKMLQENTSNESNKSNDINIPSKENNNIPNNKEVAKNDTSQVKNESNQENKTIIVEGDDEKHYIKDDEDQWYTQSDWFEIDGDITFIEN